MRFEQRISRFLSSAALAGALGAGACLLSSPGLAQSAPVVSRPVVQALPTNDAKALNDALSRLGRNPRDTEALIDAGDAARALGDFDAAIGFYRRAEEVSATNPRVKAGMARALVLSGDPVAAIPVFAEAERAGAGPQMIAADRGLAYDLVGDNAAAQRYYKAALGGQDNDELRMRLAVSQAIGGDADAAEVTLMPLLRRQDKPGWRTRAFTLAIAGKTKDAVELANTILPEKLAQSMAPYLRYMPRLTKAQQAAAANLGKFPRASEIGRDEPRIAAYRPAKIASADAALVPRGAQLGSGKAAATATSRSSGKSRDEKAEQARREAEAAESRRKAALASAEADRVAPPEPRPAIQRNGVELPPVDAKGELPPVNASPPLAARAGVALADPAPAAARIAPPPAQEKPASPAPGFDLARVGTAAPAAPPAREAPPEPGPTQLSLSEIFADLGKPATQAAPAPGAVDISRIRPARPKPTEVAKPAEEPKKPAPPAHPSRIWVQIGVGRDKDAIAFDWRRYTRQAPELFKGREAHVSEMGRTNRILAGPFATRKAANDFVADLRKEGIDGALPWTSPAGQVVDVLPAK
ncbi:hypothetical protein GCM10011494_06890 [Novosphingobium endophyticum]|uniref:SPOR domain-containing protein n=1 Tax=Novosphingobium endophyticum TaxID=1955250 RepID=A0A916TRA2_9SPHN|nr:SPOR domain-containing protein [Novosphingobium endophyticum]GGB91152.1 hypothetical protein GCM10011494_06890 [Novosphingobium endophyticum]